MFQVHSLSGPIFGRLVGSTGRINWCNQRHGPDINKTRAAGIAAAMENRLGPNRIRVRQGEECVVLLPGKPTLSSAQSLCEGALLERPTFVPHNFEKHQPLTHFVVLHISGPAPMSWRSQG